MTEPVNDPNVNPELARRNVAFGLVVFALALVLFGGTVGVAFIYLWVS